MAAINVGGNFDIYRGHGQIFAPAKSAFPPSLAVAAPTGT
jgi:hypothetical protein